MEPPPAAPAGAIPATTATTAATATTTTAPATSANDAEPSSTDEYDGESSTDEYSDSEQALDKALETIYFDITRPGGYSSLNRLYSEAKKQGVANITRDAVRKFLERQAAFTLHRNRNVHFPRSRVIAAGVAQEYDLDLADVSRFQAQNKHIRFIIILIDVFSRKVYVEPITSKDTRHVIDGMEKIFSRMHKLPKSIRHDKGGEFENAQFKQLLEKNNINNFVAVGRLKANYAERFIGTLRKKLAAYMTQERTRVYLPILQPTIEAYNNSEHSSIGMAPNDVTKGNEALVWRYNYYHSTTKAEREHGPLEPPFKFNIGDRVRHVIDKHVLAKGYRDNWSNEVFTVAERYRRDHIPIYKIESESRGLLSRSFYNQELQRVGTDQNRVREIIQEKTVKGIKLYNVRFFDRGGTEDIWLSGEQLKDYGIDTPSAIHKTS